MKKKKRHNCFYVSQVVDIDNESVVLNEELYEEIEYLTPTETFHSFEGETEIVGLNFADDDEADNFRRAVQERIRKRRDRKRPKASRRQGRKNETRSKPEVVKSSKPEVGKSSKPEVGKSSKPEVGRSTTPEVRKPEVGKASKPEVGGQPEAEKDKNGGETTSRRSWFSMKKKKSSKSGISKKEISDPFGFVHVDGMDQSSLGPTL
jgi:Wiskott-Aldrich syndrome protein